MVSATTFSDDFLTEKRKKGDPAVDAFLAQEFAGTEKKMRLYGWLQQLKDNRALDSIPEDYAQLTFISNSRILPSWADKKLMQNGSAFFVKYAEQVMQLLGLLSLPYCYAAADGAMVLYVSQRLRNDSGKRLSDTAEFIWNVLSPDAFEDQGKVFSSCLSIRFTHAIARYYTLKSESWNLGVPVNQEDMAGTNLAFSLIVIRGLRKLGYSISYAEQQAFIHLWSVIGYLLGVDEDLIPADGKTANAIEQKIKERQFKPSVQGRELTKSLIGYFKSFSGNKIPENQILGLMRHLLGEKVSELLGVPLANGSFLMPAILQLTANWPSVSSQTSTLGTYKKKYQAYKKEIESQLKPDTNIPHKV